MSVNLEAYRVKGERLYAAMVAAALAGHQPAAVREPPPKLVCETDSLEVPDLPFGVQDGFEGVIVRPKNLAHRQPNFENQVHTSGRIIICRHNFCDLDPDLGRPEQYRWTQCMGYMYQTFVPEANRHNLEQVWRYMIANDETLEVIRHVQVTLKADHRPLVVEGNTPEFFMLLASPNGKGVARMLTDYPVLFGNRIVVRVVIHDNINLCWHVEVVPGLPGSVCDSDAVEVPTDTSPTLSRRRGKKRERPRRKRVTSGHFAGASGSTAS